MGNIFVLHLILNPSFTREFNVSFSGTSSALQCSRYQRNYNQIQFLSILGYPVCFQSEPVARRSRDARADLTSPNARTRACTRASLLRMTRVYMLRLQPCGRARLSARIRAHTPRRRPIIRIISTPSRHPVIATYTLVRTTRPDARSRDPVCTRSLARTSELSSSVVFVKERPATKWRRPGLVGTVFTISTFNHYYD